MFYIRSAVGNWKPSSYICVESEAIILKGLLREKNYAVKLLLYVNAFCIYHDFSHVLADPGQMHLKTVLHSYGFCVSLTVCFPGICTSFS